jgi:glycosyltransferase involved in cell wall biosynthesis
MRLPIFIISYNRGGMLREVIDSYRRLSGVGEIVVHDNGSDDPATLLALEELRGAGVSVVSAPKIYAKEELDSVDGTVRRHFERSPPSAYVVTDCDVDMSIAAPDALMLYAELLERLPAAECVGPMLRIRDISPDYPLFNHVMNRHISQFWQQPPRWLHTSVGRVALQTTEIDTTFAVHRAGEGFRRKKMGVRVYHPYEARHLDWYAAGIETERADYERSSSEVISHWCNRARRVRFGGVGLEHEWLLYVDHDERGALTVRRMAVRK